MRRWAAIAAILVVLGGIGIAVIGVPWGGGGGPRRSELDAAGDRTYPAVMPALCRTAAAARAGRRTDAYDEFYRFAHQGLHVLAADLDARGDRALSGRLLRAKSTVEGELLRPLTPLADSVDTLIALTADGLAAVGADRAVIKGC